jgi:hypothetical protein
MGRPKTVEFYDTKKYNANYKAKLALDPERQKRILERKEKWKKENRKACNRQRNVHREKLAWLSVGRKPTTAGRLLHEQIIEAGLSFIGEQGENNLFKFVHRGRVVIERLPYEENLDVRDFLSTGTENA